MTTTKQRTYSDDEIKSRLSRDLPHSLRLTVALAVALALPEDMLFASADVADLPPVLPARSYPGAAGLDQVRSLLAAASRPMVIVGGGGWSAAAGRAARAFCEAWRLPVGAAFRCQDYVSNESPSYCGPVGIGVAPALATRVRDADLLLVVGARLERTQGPAQRDRGHDRPSLYRDRGAVT